MTGNARFAVLYSKDPDEIGIHSHSFGYGKWIFAHFEAIFDIYWNTQVFSVRMETINRIGKPSANDKNTPRNIRVSNSL